MKNVFYSLATLLLGGMLSASCTDRQIECPDYCQERFDSFIGTTEIASESKVYADNQLRVLWNADDRISVFNKYTYNQEYRFDGETGSNSGTFSVIKSDAVATGNELSTVYAVYPYREINSIGNDEVLTVQLPDEQEYTEGTFAPGMNVMVSATNDKYLKFKNVCGILSLKLGGIGSVAVSSIRLSGNNQESLAGPATITIQPGEEPNTTLTGQSSKSILLKCTNPVSLTDASIGAGFKEFWFMVPPVTFEKGFTVTMTIDNGSGWKDYTVGTNKKVTVSRSMITRMAQLNFQEAGPALETIEAVPQLHFDNVDAVGVNVLNGNFYTVSGSADVVCDDSTNARILHYNKPSARQAFYMGGISTVGYKYYPVSCDLDDYNFSLIASTAGGSNAPTLMINTVQALEGGQASVNYIVKDAERLSSEKCYMYLSATDKTTGTNVQSNPIRLCPSRKQLEAFAFNPRSGYQTSNQVFLKNGRVGYELYRTAAEAAENSPSVPVNYEGYHISLSDYIVINVSDIDPETENSSGLIQLSVSELQEIYPDLTVEYQLVDYAVGGAGTRQDAFGMIEQQDGKWLFKPAYVDRSGRSLEGGYSAGISAVGRKPIVLAKIVDKNTRKLLLAGYFKLLIVKQAVFPGGSGSGTGTEPIQYATFSTIFKDFDPLPLFMDSYLETNWVDMSGGLLEEILHIDYASYKNQYQCDGLTYYKASNGSMTSSDSFGTIEYLRDTGMSAAVDDKIRVVLTAEQAQRIGANNTKTLYCRLFSNQQEIYLGFVIRIGSLPSVSFAKLNSEYWYSDVQSTSNTVRNFGPTMKSYGSFNNGSDILNRYDVCLEEFWVSNTIMMSLDDYNYYNGNTSCSYDFQFSKQQPRINGRALSVSNDRLTLSYQGEQIAQIVENDPTHHMLNVNHDSEVFKTILNSFPIEATDISQMLYFGLDLNAYINGYYASSWQMYMRYISPLRFYVKAPDLITAADPSVWLGDLFTVQDNRGNYLFEYNANYGSYVYTTIYGVQLPNYYAPFILKLNFASARISSSSVNGYLRAICPNASMTLKSPTQSIPVGLSEYPLDLSNINELLNYSIDFDVYSFGQTDAFTVILPMSITYPWGTFTWEHQVSVR